jgi:hypothetical protein
MNNLTGLLTKFSMYGNSTITTIFLTIYLIGTLYSLLKPKVYVKQSVFLILAVFYFILSFLFFFKTVFGWSFIIVGLYLSIIYIPLIAIFSLNAIITHSKNDLINLRLLPFIFIFQATALIFNLYDCGDCGGHGNVPMTDLYVIIFHISLLIHGILLYKFMFSNIPIKLAKKESEIDNTPLSGHNNL